MRYYVGYTAKDGVACYAIPEGTDVYYTGHVPGDVCMDGDDLPFTDDPKSVVVRTYSDFYYAIEVMKRLRSRGMIPSDCHAFVYNEHFEGKEFPPLLTNTGTEQPE